MSHSKDSLGWAGHRPKPSIWSVSISLGMSGAEPRPRLVVAGLRRSSGNDLHRLRGPIRSAVKERFRILTAIPPRRRRLATVPIRTLPHILQRVGVFCGHCVQCWAGGDSGANQDGSRYCALMADSPV